MGEGNETSRFTVKAGDLVGGKYRIDRMIGAGGMGVVVLANHEELDRKVAIKLLLPETLENKEMLDRFQREGRAAAKLRSDHVVHVFDVGVFDDGAPYIVMEYLEGRDLSDILLTHGPLPVPIAAQLLVQACEAIGEAHLASIIHRDIKPSNLFLTCTVSGTPRIKVLDFGISKLKSSNASDHVAATRSTVVMGSPLYMSPEQMCASKNVDPRSDVWSLGVVLYELLSGRVPWAGRSILEVAAGVLNTPPENLSVLRNSLPPGIVEATHRCLAKEPADRYACVEDLAEALMPFCEVDPGEHWDLKAVLAGASKRNGESVGADTTVTIGSAPTDPAPDPNSLAPPFAAPTARATSTTAASVATVPSATAATARDGSNAWVGVAAGVSATLALAAILIVMDMRRTPARPTPVSSIAVAARSAPPNSDVPQLQRALVYPCAESGDKTESLAWCDVAGKSVAVCARGLVPTGKSGICDCPPGGTEVEEVAATGCASPVKTDDERSREVSEVVARLRPSFRSCYSRNVEASPTLQGKVKVEVKLAPDGRVYAATVIESRLPDAATQECLIEKVSAAVFAPPVEGHSRIVIPIVLLPESEQ